MGNLAEISKIQGRIIKKRKANSSFMIQM